MAGTTRRRGRPWTAAGQWCGQAPGEWAASVPTLVCSTYIAWWRHLLWNKKRDTFRPSNYWKHKICVIAMPYFISSHGKMMMLPYTCIIFQTTIMSYIWSLFLSLQDYKMVISAFHFALPKSGVGQVRKSGQSLPLAPNWNVSRSQMLFSDNTIFSIFETVWAWRNRLNIKRSCTQKKQITFKWMWLVSPFSQQSPAVWNTFLQGLSQTSVSLPQQGEWQAGQCQPLSKYWSPSRA